MPNTQTKILITGGTGFAGSHLVELLLAEGYTDVHVTAFTTDPSYVHQLLPAEQIHVLDLSDATATEALIKQLQPDQVYHLAAMAEVGSSFQAAEKTIVNNTVLQLNLLEAVRTAAPQARVLVIGSAQEYDFIQQEQTSNQPIKENHPLGPANPYGVSKVTQDLLGLSYCYAYGLNVVRARPFNHTGERQAPMFAIPSFAKQIAEVEKGSRAQILVGNLDGVRDFTDVKDVVRAYLVLMEKGQVGQVYNIGSGQGHTVKEVLELLVAQSQRPISIETDPEKLRPLDVPTVIADISHIAQLGWQPTIPLNETLKRVLSYWRDQI